MAIWLVRAGSHGEFEQKFGLDGRIYITWDRLLPDLSQLRDRSALFDALAQAYPDAKAKRLHNWASQLWPFAHEMKKGDLVVMPLKSQPSIAIAEITGDYHYDPKAPAPFFHWRTVRWLGDAVPRTHFRQDLLNSFGAFLTICRIQRNDAQARIETMKAGGWSKDPRLDFEEGESPDTAETDEKLDLEELGRDQIAKFIGEKFREHDLARLVEGILKAQGYTTYRSPEGPDGGVDILAGAGPLGFGSPQLCVEVKSGKAPIDRPTVDKLLGAMSKFGAAQGLFVAWNGFKSTVQKELAQSFFRVRLWSQKELLEALFSHYDKLDEDLRAELPLKRVWTVAVQEE